MDIAVDNDKEVGLDSVLQTDQTHPIYMGLVSLQYMVSMFHFFKQIELRLIRK